MPAIRQPPPMPTGKPPSAREWCQLHHPRPVAVPTPVMPPYVGHCGVCGSEIEAHRKGAMVCGSCNWFDHLSHRERAERDAYRRSGLKQLPGPECFEMWAYGWNEW